ncbi:MAG TPA: dihydrodipicolinate reductase C-terminal domain-containing protein, partial [Blastocatellia bacterium]|nr:dihydrodipicolinate reductase C-terminal domain-containing protein [Blastocatellia bacterium]
FGYGKMGKMIEQAAARSGLEIACVIDPAGGSRGKLTDADVCLDFSEPGAVMGNIKTAADARVSMVVGTTGWYDRINEARQIVKAGEIGLVYGSNFSVGVNLMFKLAAYASEIFKQFELHDPFIEEAHHKFKLDAPSGTALSLKRIVETTYGGEVPTSSTRAGYFPGKHTLGFDSEADTLEIIHTARTRAGFADGAVIAARWIAERKGFYEFSEIINEQLGLGSIERET